MKFEDLLIKPLWQMTGEEFLFLQQSSNHTNSGIETDIPNVQNKRYEYGIRGIAKIFGCSIPTANRIKKSGKIDRAITQLGRKIIIDAELALEMAQRNTKNIRGGRV